MSLDNVYTRMRTLEEEMNAFNTTLRSNFDALSQAGARLHPYWDDAMHREYDGIWKPLEETMNRYIQVVGPDYSKFLEERIYWLESYLGIRG